MSLPRSEVGSKVVLVRSVVDEREGKVGYSEQWYSQPGRCWAVGRLRIALARRRRVEAQGGVQAKRQNLEGNRIGI